MVNRNQAWLEEDDTLETTGGGRNEAPKILHQSGRKRKITLWLIICVGAFVGFILLISKGSSLTTHTERTEVRL